MANLDSAHLNLLKEEYQRKVGKNPRYSKNSYARFLGINNTYLSKLLSGKILLSLDIAEKITKKLKLDGKTRAVFLLSAADELKCHSLYRIDSSLTDCDPADHEINLKPPARRKNR